MSARGVLGKFKSAAFAALIMLGLAFPIIAYHADMDLTRGLFLESRWPLVLVLVGGTFILRLLSEIIFGRMRSKPHAAKEAKPAWIVSPLVYRLLGFTGIGGLIAFPLAAVFTLGPAGSLKWIDNAGIQILIYVMLGWGLNIVVGLAGLLDLGYVAFYAVGAYAYALLATDLGWSFWLCLPICGAIAALFGIALGFPVLRGAAIISPSSLWPLAKSPALSRSIGPRSPTATQASASFRRSAFSAFRLQKEPKDLPRSSACHFFRSSGRSFSTMSSSRSHF